MTLRRTGSIISLPSFVVVVEFGSNEPDLARFEVEATGAGDCS